MPSRKESEAVLRSIIISPDEEISTRLESALTALGLVTVLRILNAYPTATELERLLRALNPDLIFLSFVGKDQAVETVRLLEAEVKGIQITAIHRSCDSAALSETIRAGVREFMEYPFEGQAVIDSLRHSADLLKESPPVYRGTTHIFSFLPSKAGVGTSTLALNVSAALARRDGSHVLLADFDLNCGMVRFLLKLQNERSIVDALEHSATMDESLWPQMVTSSHQMDVLHAGRIRPGLRIEGQQIHSLIQFASRNYDALCFDLSGNLEKYSLDIMQESRRILLVCTAETPSLHLAREKLQFLKTLDLDSRVGVILNRVYRKSVLGKAEVEEILEVPVMATLVNDYQGVNRSNDAGTVVDSKSELGKEHAKLAASLLEGRPSQEHGAAAGQQRFAPDYKNKNKFLELFTIAKTAEREPSKA